jgi:cell wall-associated NlpC family hydrolase
MNPSSPNRFARMKVALVAIAFASTSVAPAMAQDAKTVEVKPFETRPFTTISNSAQTLRDSIVQMARAQIGTKYKFGGGTPEKGFDCSGLVKFVMAALNLDVPRTAKQQAKVGLAIIKDTSRLLPGDLLTFGRGKKGAVSHVGIYVGDGRFVQASSAAGRVIETPLNRPASPRIKVWRGARRILVGDDSAASATPPAVATKSGN